MTDRVAIPSSTAQKPSLAVRAVERASKLLAGEKSTRRRFLIRAAVVGSALAVDPLGYVLKPGTAYASVCGSANTCGAGWSAFCCTINGGANTCPDYSYVAGWWKVDASAFCLGAARYYIDCNRRRNRSCRCRCSNSGCDRRRVCCNNFRYGQCNTQIGGVTEVVCRIVTCTPPWEWDPACGRTIRTNNATRSHSSTCLPRTNPTRIEIKYQDMGLVGSILGRAETKERDAARGGRKRRYANGMILWHRNHGAHEVHGPVANRYRDSGADSGPLGYPTTDHRPVGDGKGQFVRFQHGSIYRHPTHGVRIVLGRTDRRYRNLRGPRGQLGYPTSATHEANGPGKVTDFQRGSIFMSPDTDAVEVTGQVLSVYRSRGGPAGSKLGFPVSPAQSMPDGGRRQRFEDGLIIGPGARKVYAVRGAILQRWTGEARGPEGPWGYPVTHTQEVVDTDSLWTRFEHVVVYWSRNTGVHWMARGPIYTRYREKGGAKGPLGFPVADQTTSAGLHQMTFEHGVITYDPRNDETTDISATT